MVMPPQKVFHVSINLSGAFLLFQRGIPEEKSSSTEIKQVSMCRPAFTKIWNTGIVAFLSNPATRHSFFLLQPPIEVKLSKNIQDDEIINTGQLNRCDMS